jgi:hypothetical protein
MMTRTNRLRNLEALAIFTTAIGVVALVGVYFPILNSGFYLTSVHEKALPSIAHYVVGTPIALLILAIGWRLNRKAERLRKEERGATA